MKTLIILTATEEKLEYLPSVRSNIVLYIGEMNLEDEDTAPANALCFNGKLTKEAKGHIADQIQKEYDTDILALFFELKETACPDDYIMEVEFE